MKNNEIPFDSPTINEDMTVREALDLLNQCGTNIDSLNEPIVLSLINNSLGRSIPRKVIHDFMIYCPNCREQLLTNQKKYKYCHHCGQKLDWRD